jgi:hypothetical protein
MHEVVRRSLSFLALAFLVTGAFAFPRISRPYDLMDEPQLAPALAPSMQMTGAAVRGGFIAVWRDGVSLRMARLDEHGAALGNSSIILPQGVGPGSSLFIASDGVDAIVVLNDHPGYGKHIVLKVSADGSVTPRSPESGWITALVWNGTSYIALVRVAYRSYRTLEIDRDGDFVAEGAFPDLEYDYVDSAPRFFAAGPIVSMVRQSVRSRTVSRAKVTNDAGHVIASDWVPLPYETDPYDSLIAAGAAPSGMYVVNWRSGNSESTVQFLDADGLPNAAPVALEGFHLGIVRTALAPDGAVLVLESDGRVARVVLRRAIDRRGDDPHRGDLETGFAWESGENGPDIVRATTVWLPEFRYPSLTTFLPAVGGALLVAPVSIYYDGMDWSVPAATRLRAGATLALDGPEVLAYSKPDMRYAAAAAHDGGFLVAWQQHGLKGAEIWMRGVDALGVPRGKARFVSMGERPKVASQGDSAFVIWTGIRANQQAVQAIRVGRDDIPIDPVPVIVTTLPGYSVVRDVTFDGMQFDVFLGAYGLQSAIGVVVPPAGSADPFTVTASADISYWWRVSCVAGAPGNTLLTTVANGIEVVTLRNDLTPHAAPRAISILGGSPLAAWNGEQFVVVWWHVDHYRYARVSASGEPLDSEFGRVLGNLPPASPAGSDFKIVVRGDQFLIASPSRISLMRHGAAAETTAIEGDRVDAFVARADGAMLLVTATASSGDGYLGRTTGRLSVRGVTP